MQRRQAASTTGFFNEPTPAPVLARRRRTPDSQPPEPKHQTLLNPDSDWRLVSDPNFRLNLVPLEFAEVLAKCADMHKGWMWASYMAEAADTLRKFIVAAHDAVEADTSAMLQGDPYTAVGRRHVQPKVAALRDLLKAPAPSRRPVIENVR